MGAYMNEQKEVVFKKLMSAVVIASLLFSFGPVSPASALRNPQAQNAPVLGCAVGKDMVAGVAYAERWKQLVEAGLEEIFGDDDLVTSLRWPDEKEARDVVGRAINSLAILALREKVRLENRDALRAFLLRKIPYGIYVGTGLGSRTIEEDLRRKQVFPMAGGFSPVTSYRDAMRSWRFDPSRPVVAVVDYVTAYNLLGKAKIPESLTKEITDGIEKDWDRLLIKAEISNENINAKEVTDIIKRYLKYAYNDGQVEDTADVMRRLHELIYSRIKYSEKAFGLYMEIGLYIFKPIVEANDWGKENPYFDKDKLRYTLDENVLVSTAPPFGQLPAYEAGRQRLQGQWQRSEETGLFSSDYIGGSFSDAPAAYYATKYADFNRFMWFKMLGLKNPETDPENVIVTASKLPLDTVEGKGHFTEPDTSIKGYKDYSKEVPIILEWKQMSEAQKNESKRKFANGERVDLNAAFTFIFNNKWFNESVFKQIVEKHPQFAKGKAEFWWINALDIRSKQHTTEPEGSPSRVVIVALPEPAVSGIKDKERITKYMAERDEMMQKLLSSVQGVALEPGAHLVIRESGDFKLEHDLKNIFKGNVKNPITIAGEVILEVDKDTVIEAGTNLDGTKKPLSLSCAGKTIRGNHPEEGIKLDDRDKENLRKWGIFVSPMTKVTIRGKGLNKSNLYQALDGIFGSFVDGKKVVEQIYLGGKEIMLEDTVKIENGAALWNVDLSGETTVGRLVKLTDVTAKNTTFAGHSQLDSWSYRLPYQRDADIVKVGAVNSVFAYGAKAQNQHVQDMAVSDELITGITTREKRQQDPHILALKDLLAEASLIKITENDDIESQIDKFFDPIPEDVAPENEIRRILMPEYIPGMYTEGELLGLPDWGDLNNHRINRVSINTLKEFAKNKLLKPDVVDKVRAEVTKVLRDQLENDTHWRVDEDSNTLEDLKPDDNDSEPDVKAAVKDFLQNRLEKGTYQRVVDALKLEVEYGDEINAAVKKVLEARLVKQCTDDVKSAVGHLLQARLSNGAYWQASKTSNQLNNAVRQVVRAVLIKHNELGINEEFNPYEEVNKFADIAALAAIKEGLTLRQYCQLAVAAGFVDLDNLRLREMYDESGYDFIKQELAQAESKNFAIECWNLYEERLISSGRPVLNILYPDNNCEIVMDLKSKLEQLKANPNLVVVIVGKDGQYSNDASWQDVEEVLVDDMLDYINGKIRSPRLGGLWAMMVSEQVEHILKQAVKRGQINKAQKENILEYRKEKTKPNAQARFFNFHAGPRLQGFDGKKTSKAHASLLFKEKTDAVTRADLVKLATGIGGIALQPEGSDINDLSLFKEATNNKILETKGQANLEMTNGLNELDSFHMVMIKGPGTRIISGLSDTTMPMVLYFTPAGTRSFSGYAQMARRDSSELAGLIDDKFLKDAKGKLFGIAERTILESTRASATIREMLDTLENKRWLFQWKEIFDRFTDMSKQNPALFEAFRIQLDQTDAGFEFKRQTDIAVPKRWIVNDSQKELIVQYLVAAVNNEAWFFLKKPEDTDNSHTRILLSGDYWANKVSKHINDFDNKYVGKEGPIKSLTEKMLYGPVSLEVVDELTGPIAAESGVLEYKDATTFSPKAENSLVVGVDIGGTNMKFVVVKEGRVVYSKVVRSWASALEKKIAKKGIAAVLAEEIHKQLRAAQRVRRAKVGDLQAVGFSWPGPVRGTQILGSVSIEKILSNDKEKELGLIQRITKGELEGNKEILEEEFKKLKENAFMDLLREAFRQTFGSEREISIKPYRDAFVEAFGVATVRYNPEFGNTVTSADNGAVTFTIGTGVGGYIIDKGGKVPVTGNPFLYEFGRVIVDMQGTTENRSTHLSGTIRQLFDKDMLASPKPEDIRHIGEELAATALMMCDAFGKSHITITGGNAKQEITNAANDALQILRPHTLIREEISPVVENTGIPNSVEIPATIYSPAVGAAFAALADSQAANATAVAATAGSTGQTVTSSEEGSVTEASSTGTAMTEHLAAAGGKATSLLNGLTTVYKNRGNDWYKIVDLFSTSEHRRIPDELKFRMQRLNEKADKAGKDIAFKLAEIGPEAVPFLVTALDEMHFTSGDYSNLSGNYSNLGIFRAIVLALGKIGPEAAPAVPLITEGLTMINNHISTWAEAEIEHAIKKDSYYEEEYDKDTMRMSALREGLRKTWEVVVIALGNIGPEAEPAVTELVIAFTDEMAHRITHPEIIVNTFGKIGRGAKEAVIPLRIALMDSQDSEFSEAITAALKNIGSAPRRTQVRRKDKQTAKGGQRDKEKPIKVLIEQLSDRPERYYAVQTLGEIGPTEPENIKETICKALISALDMEDEVWQDGDPDYAAWGYPDGKGAPGYYMLPVDFRTRSEIFRALVRIGSTYKNENTKNYIRNALIGQSHDKDRMIRERAIKALSEIGLGRKQAAQASSTGMLNSVEIPATIYTPAVGAAFAALSDVQADAAAAGVVIPKEFTGALSKNSLYTEKTKALFRNSGLTNSLLYELAKGKANYKGVELEGFISDKAAVSEFIKETVDVLQSDVYKGVCDIFTGAYGWPREKLNRYIIYFAHQKRVGLKEFFLGLSGPEAKARFTPEFVKEKYVDMEPGVVVLGGGHGAASTTDILRQEGYTVSVGVNAGDWGGGSWKLKKAMFDAWGLWITMPGDYTNVLGIGFSEADQPAIANLLNLRFPKISGAFSGTMKKLFIDMITAEVKKENIKVNSRTLTFISFCLGIAAEMDNALDNDVFNYKDKDGNVQNIVSENSLQNFLHVGTMIYSGAYRKRANDGASNAVDPDRFLVGSYLLEKAVDINKSGRIMPGYFEGDEYTKIFTKHAGQRPDAKYISGGVNVILEGAKNPRSRYARWVKNPSLARLTDYRLSPAPQANPELIEQINRCKMVVITPGNTYESVFTILYARGVPQALKRAKEDGRPVVWALNPVGLLFTYGYTIEDYVEALKKVIGSATNRDPQSVRLGEYISYMLINNPKEPEAEQVLEEAMNKFKEIRDTDPAGYAKVSFREPLGMVGEDATDKHLVDLLITREGLSGFKFDNFLSPQIKKVTIRSVEIKQAAYGRELTSILNSQYGQSSARAGGNQWPAAVSKAAGEAALLIGPKDDIRDAMEARLKNRSDLYGKVIAAQDKAEAEKLLATEGIGFTVGLVVYYPDKPADSALQIEALDSISAGDVDALEKEIERLRTEEETLIESK